jgi:hypothetical protein
MEPILNKSARDGKLQSHSTRTYCYDAGGYPTEVLLEDQSFLPTEGQRKVVTISSPREIRNVTTTYISRIEKEEGIQNRKLDDESRKELLLIERLREEKKWERTSKAYARKCGIKSHLMCTKVGCVRQVTTYTRLAQHELSEHHQSNGNPRSQSSCIKRQHDMDGFSVKEMALNYFVLKVSNTDDRQKRKEDRQDNNEDAQANDVEIMGHDKQVAGNEDINIASGEMTGVQERVAVQPMIYAVQNNIFAKFGWAKRASLKHPGFTPAMTDFLK